MRNRPRSILVDEVEESLCMFGYAMLCMSTLRNQKQFPDLNEAETGMVYWFASEIVSEFRFHRH